MQFARLGSTDLEVSRLCLGTAFRSAADSTTCERVVRAAAELGCNFIDCANAYRDGESERIVGRAIEGRRGQFIVATKAGADLAAEPGTAGLSRRAILAACDGSLRRLKTDYIDLYLCHFPDPRTPLPETLEALDQLHRDGKIRYAGLSNFPVDLLTAAVTLTREHRWLPPVCSQVPYSLLQRSCEREMIPTCTRLGIAVTAFAPTAIGLLSGRFRRGEPPPPGTPWHDGPYNFEAAMTDDVDRIIRVVEQVARRHARTPSQVALAWCLSRPQPVAAIIGSDSLEQVQENFTAVDWTLPPEDLAELDRISTGQNLEIRKDRPEGYRSGG